MTTLTGRQFRDLGLTDWRMLAQAIHARFATGDFARGVAFVQQVAELAEAANHHPDVTLTYPYVDLKLLTHDADNAVTDKDVDLARRISAAAAEQGITADPVPLTRVELALDTADAAGIGPFWAAVLTGSADAYASARDADDTNDVVDPNGRSPFLWFQPTESHDEPRQRFHLDVWVPNEQVEARVRAAVEAGGAEVHRTPTFVVLADSDGNKACICFSAELE